MSSRPPDNILSDEGPRKRIHLLAGLMILAVCWIAMESLTIRRGCDLTDFGRSSTIAHRMAFGDRPFLDSWGSVVSLAEYYASWLFRLKPDATLLDLRLIDSGVQFVAFAVVYFVLARLTTPLLALIGTMASIPGVKVWFTQVPSYQTVPATLAILSIALLWAAMHRRTRAVRYVVGGLAGLVGVLATTTRLPHLGLLAFPAVALLSAWATQTRRRETLESAIGYWSGFIVAVGVVAGLIYHAELAEVALHRFRAASSMRGATTCVSFFHDALQRVLLGAIIFANYLALCGLLMSKALARMPRWLRIVLTLVLTIVCVKHIRDYGECKTPLLGFGFVCVTLGMIVFRPLPHQTPSQRRAALDRLFLYLTAVFITLLSMIGSNTGTGAAIRSAHFLIALSVILVLELPGRLRYLGKDWFADPVLNRVAAGGVLAGIVLASSLWFAVYGPYRDLYALHRPDAHVPFKSARLAGVTSTPQRVELIDRVVEYVKDRVQPGSLILAYYDVPLLYFASDTRPATFTTWVMEGMSPLVEQAALDDMIQRGRIPELVIRNNLFPGREWPDFAASENEKAYTDTTYSADDPKRRPINAWVEAHYAFAERIGPLEIWQPKDVGIVVAGDSSSPARQSPQGNHQALVATGN